MYFLFFCLVPVSATLEALTIVTVPAATTFLAKEGAFLPSKALAAALATRPSVLFVASMVIIGVRATILYKLNTRHLTPVALARRQLGNAHISTRAPAIANRSEE